MSVINIIFKTQLFQDTCAAITMLGFVISMAFGSDLAIAFLHGGL